MNSDILVIGGGVIGLSIARELRKRRAGRITVLDRRKAGHEASWAAAGILAPQAETDQIDDFYRMCSASRDMYPAFAEELLGETGVDIELDRSGTLYLAFTGHDVVEIRRRFDWQKSAGLEVFKCSAAECRELEPWISQHVQEGLLFPNDWQVENRKLVDALIEYAQRNEISLVEGTKIEHVVVEDRRVAEVRSAHNINFSADVVILATGAWTSLIKIGETPVSVDVKPIRGQMICFRPSERQFRRVIYSPRGYLVPRSDGRILAGATVEDVGFYIETTEDGTGLLKETAAEMSPHLRSMDISDQWAGLRPFAAGGLPVIGQLPSAENLFIATAHYRNGILLAPFTAKVMVDLIMEDRVSQLLPPFGPQPFRSAEEQCSKV